jgi:hypothetical protein
VVWHFWR